MSSERKGKVYESIVYSALKELADVKRLDGELFWNQTPSGMTIEPDFTIGSSPDAPRFALLVTHCASPRNSDMKGWRNLGELVEFKVALRKSPVVAAISFGDIKQDLGPLHYSAFDSFRWVTPTAPERFSPPQPWLVVAPWATELETFVNEIEPAMPAKCDRAPWIVELLRGLGNANRLRIGYVALRELLCAMLHERNRRIVRMWEEHRLRPLPSTPSARTTSLRNGLSKLLLFPSPMDALACARSGKQLSSGNYNSLLTDNKLVRVISSGGREVVRVNDEEIIGLARSATDGQLAHLVGLYRTAGARWFNQVVTAAAVPQMLEALKKEWACISNPGVVFRLMRDAHHADLCGIRVGYTWTYYRFMDAIKLGAGQVQGYGLSQLQRDIERLRDTNTHVTTVADTGGLPAGSITFRAVRSIERLISVQLGDWNSRGSKELFNRYPVDMAEIAIAISSRLCQVDPVILNDVHSFFSAIFQANITNGFATWRHYEPLKELIHHAIPSAKLESIRSCYAEAAGKEIREDSGSTTVLRVGSTLINWQTAHGSHTKDKKKELCGRAVGLRYNCRNDQFLVRTSVRRMFLVLDGTWNDPDIRSLLRAGWDDIFYPDELDRLIEAIV